MADNEAYEPKSIYEADPAKAAAAVHAKNPGTSNYSAEQRAYSQQQVGEWAVDKIERAIKDDFAVASVDAYQQHIADSGATNIHAAREVAAPPKLDPAQVELQSTFNALEAELGFSNGVLNEIKAGDADTARSVLTSYARAIAAKTTPGTVDNLLRVVASDDTAKQSLLSAVEQETSRWNSDKYGRAGVAMTPEQAEETRKIVHHALSQADALERAGQPVPKLPALLRRARTALDDSYVPAAGKSAANQPSALRDPNAATNIHQLLQRNPF